MTPDEPHGQGTNRKPSGRVDLVVVGAGACGMVAAVAAARRGLTVTLLDKGEEPAEGRVEAEAVLLALNGFGGNERMVREHPGGQVAEALYYGSPNNTGEGISWGIELGAATEHMGAYQGHASVAHPDEPLVTWGVVVKFAGGPLESPFYGIHVRGALFHS